MILKSFFKKIISRFLQLSHPNEQSGAIGLVFSAKDIISLFKESISVFILLIVVVLDS